MRPIFSGPSRQETRQLQRLFALREQIQCLLAGKPSIPDLSLMNGPHSLYPLLFGLPEGMIQSLKLLLNHVSSTVAIVNRLFEMPKEGKTTCLKGSIDQIDD